MTVHNPFNDIGTKVLYKTDAMREPIHATTSGMTETGWGRLYVTILSPELEDGRQRVRDDNLVLVEPVSDRDLPCGCRGYCPANGADSPHPLASLTAMASRSRIAEQADTTPPAPPACT